MSLLPVTSHATVRGLKIAYHRYGFAERPPILCLHGFLDHGTSFGAVAEGLLDRWSLIAVDFRGHGASEWIGSGGYYHFADYTSDALAVIQAAGLTQFPILAHSMGGSVAVFLASILGARVESMVLLEGLGPEAEPAAGAPDRLRRFCTALADPALTGDVAARRDARRVIDSVAEAADRLRRLNPALTEARALELAQAATEPYAGGVAWRFDPLHRTPSARPFDLDELMAFFRTVEAPVLSLFGDATGWAPPDLEARHACFKNVEVGRVLGTGHNIHHDRPSLVADAVRWWLAGDRRTPVPGIQRVTGALKPWPPSP